jgi:hypothetical protein
MEKAKSDKLQMIVSLNVQGKEGLNLSLTYTDTDMKTVLLVQKALTATLSGLVDAQIAGEI